MSQKPKQTLQPMRGFDLARKTTSNGELIELMLKDQSLVRCLVLINRKRDHFGYNEI